MANPKRGFTRILVAVDGSDVSRLAAEHAARIARQDGAELVILHVVPSPSSEVPGGLSDYYDGARTEVRRWMTDIEAAVASHGVGPKIEIVVGALSVLDAILGYAETISADLIVSGTRGRTPSARLRVGSVASGLVSYANCAVMVVR